MTGNNGLSRKEMEVLERQRRLAQTRVEPKNRAVAPPSSAAASATAAAAPSAQGVATQQRLTSIIGGSKSKARKQPPPKQASSPAPAAQVRPSRKRPTSATAVLAAARSKAARLASDSEKSSSTKEAAPKKSATSISSLIQRKTRADGGGASESNEPQKSSFSKLVATTVTTNRRIMPTSDEDYYNATSFVSLRPEDFWKNLREWDVITQLALQLKQQKEQIQQRKQRQNMDKSEKDTEESKTKPLPVTFLNARHYVAAWGPLCLAETRAQIMSDLVSEWPQKKRQWIMCKVVPTDAATSRTNTDFFISNDVFEPSDSITLKINASPGVSDNNMSFVTNDLCLLVPPHLKDMFFALMHGKYQHSEDDFGNGDSSSIFRKWALIGHSKFFRRKVQDVIVEVSKRKWALLGEQKMVLFRLGANVTALREFTALCRMDQLPLQRFLLGQHLENPQARLGVSGKTDELLAKMGGDQALGKGFTKYAQKKFNPSQLTAIAASAHEYGEGGFTLIKGPPGTGKTTTLVAVLNSLHIRQYNKYYEEVRAIAKKTTGRSEFALNMARRSKPRLLVCAPSNAAVDNIILKIIEDGFIDGQGQRYNPSMIRIGVGQSQAVRAVSLEDKVDSILSEHSDMGELTKLIERHKLEFQQQSSEITRLKRRILALQSASPWPLSKDWEIRIDEETFDDTGRVYFVNHKEKHTTFEVPPPPEPGEKQFFPSAMPEYRLHIAALVKKVEQCFSIKNRLERCTIVKGSVDNGASNVAIRQALETQVVNNVHMIMTTLGTAGSRVLEAADKFEVVVVDEAAQSVEPATLAALNLGSRHCVLVGDPQQLPATIFNVSGKTTKYDRSLFQRLEEAKQPVYMLNEQYRMHPEISHFPRHIFYGGTLLDGPNVKNPKYGNPMRKILCANLPKFRPFTVLDLDSQEQRGGTSLSNPQEAHLAVHLYQKLAEKTQGLLRQSRVAIITPYAQQANLLRRYFDEALGPQYEQFVEVNTVDAFQGREALCVIFSAVRAAGSKGIGFLSDVRRMNVALTRAKYFLFVIARCQSIVLNPYWDDLVQHARKNQAVLRVRITNKKNPPTFADISEWNLESAGGGHDSHTISVEEVVKPKPLDPRKFAQRSHHAAGPPPPPPPPTPPRIRSAEVPPVREDPRKKNRGYRPSAPAMPPPSKDPRPRKPNRKDPRLKDNG